MAREKEQWYAKFNMIHTTTVRNGALAVAFKVELQREASRIVYAVLSPDEAIERGKELIELGERLQRANARKSAGA